MTRHPDGDSMLKILTPTRRLIRLTAVGWLIALTGCSTTHFSAGTAGRECLPCDGMGCDDMGYAGTGCEDCESPMLCDGKWGLGSDKYVRCLDEMHGRADAARRANIAMRQDYASEPSLDVQGGYADAFIDIAMGASGELPPVPPERYWSTCFRTAEGHARAQDWFAGYAVGSSRAMASCRHHFNKVPSSGQVAYETEETSTQHSGISAAGAASPSPAW